MNNATAPDDLRNCDIVMKGGITSGIVYPPAIREIANAFKFVNIGGTSAGAIAACATAAAEYRRQQGGGLAGFERFATVPFELGANDRLFHLFVPTPEAKPIFDAVVATFDAKSIKERLVLVVRLLGGSLRIGAACGATAGAVLVALCVFVEPKVISLPGVIADLGLALCGALIGASIQGVRYAVDLLPKQFYGLCTGCSISGPPALDDWLGALINDIAKLPANEPLTFGHLWYGPKRMPPNSGAVRDDSIPPDDARINLQMVATCLSHGRPYTFPVDDSNTFFFDPEEMAQYFSQDVVTWLTSHSPRGSGELFELPSAADLPIIVAARMSLAFPLLLGAVKLYATDSTLPPNAPPQPCWFSDGGLTSNFPI